MSEASSPETTPRPSKAGYQRERRKLSTVLYFRSPEEKQRWKEAAKRAGFGSLNAYIIEMALNAASGTYVEPEVLEGLRAEREKLSRWYEAAREDATELRADLRLLRAKCHDLEILLSPVSEHD